MVVWFAFDVQLLINTHTFSSSMVHSVVLFQHEPSGGKDRMCDVITNFASKQLESVCFQFQMHCNNKTEV